MGLKCSVIGHKYGEVTVEREREEQGSEVVITIQERENCKRCGKTRIVSENKEVTAIETPSDIASDVIDEDEAAETDETPSEPDTASEDRAQQESAADEGLDGTVDAVDPDADDAEILGEGDDSSAGGDSELADQSSEVSIAAAEESDPQRDAEDGPDSDDGVIIDEGEEDEAGDRQPGEWPDEPDEEEDDWAPETDGSEKPAEGSDVEPFGGNAVTVPNGQFHCPECEFTTDVASSSLREGDFCPECHMGALVNTAE